MLWTNIYFLFFRVIMNNRGVKMKSIIKIGILLLLLFLVIHFKKPITNFIAEKIIFKQGVIIEEANAYQLNYNFDYVQETEDFYAKDKKQLLNILYTALNHGSKNFYFYCQYDNCEDDLTAITNNEDLIHINNFLHPYNSFQKLNFTIYSLRKIYVDVERFYNEEDIEIINSKIDTIIKEKISNDMEVETKIKIFHDYIASITNYDKEYIDNELNDIYNPSHKAIGPLIYGKALCGGYADVLAIFLNRLNIPNYRIASEYHVWNLVNIDNQWLHVDITWDDPSNDNNITLDTFLLITTNQLQNLHTKQHTYPKDIYTEAN